MGYSINYQERNGKNKITGNYPSSACFGKIFDNGINKDTAKIVLWIPKLEVDEKLFEQWLTAINAAGFTHLYHGRQTEWDQIPDVTAAKPHYIVEVPTIDITKLTQLTTTLTLIRCAYDYPDGHMGKAPFKIVENFKNVVDALPDVDPLHAIIMGHIIYGRGGHHLCHMDSNLRLFTFAEFMEVVNTTSPDVHKGGDRVYLHKAWKSFATFKGDLPKTPKELYATLTDGNDAKQLKVYVVGGANEYANWLPKHTKVKTVKSADLVMFTGGEDVTPSYYGEPKNPRTYNSEYRDQEEKAIFEQAKAAGKKMLGICRGSQFLCAMSGGKLVQHQQNPAYIHPIELYDGTSIKITSTHHQAQYPFNLKKWDYKIIGHTVGMSPMHEGGTGEELNPPVEAEIVLYKKTNALGIQGHPELSDYQRQHPEDIKRIQKLFDDFMADKL